MIETASSTHFPPSTLPPLLPSSINPTPSPISQPMSILPNTILASSSNVFPGYTACTHDAT